MESETTNPNNKKEMLVTIERDEGVVNVEGTALTANNVMTEIRGIINSMDVLEGPQGPKGATGATGPYKRKRSRNSKASI